MCPRNSSMLPFLSSLGKFTTCPCLACKLLDIGSGKVSGQMKVQTSERPDFHGAIGILSECL